MKPVHAKASTRPARAATAITITGTVAAAANTIAEPTLPVNRCMTETGRVRRYASHGSLRSMEMPTPNWKKAMPSTAYAAKDAISTEGSTCFCGKPKRTKKPAGSTSVGTRNDG